MEQEWRCTKCNTLLGVGRESRLHLRYKEVQYIIDGGDFNITAVCRNCSTINERHITSPAYKSKQTVVRS
jgi:phage FluMu protein Com